MRELKTGQHRFTKVIVKDDPGAGGANHHYEILSIDTNEEFAWVDFQNGPVKQNGVNGCFQEDLLAIVVDRLESFQKGPFACTQNELALTSIQKAMYWLNHRTEDRQDRGVEGENKK